MNNVIGKKIKGFTNYLITKDEQIYSIYSQKYLQTRSNKSKGGLIKLLKDNGNPKNPEDWVEFNVKHLHKKYYSQSNKPVEYILYYTTKAKGKFYTINSRTREKKTVMNLKDIQCKYKYNISKIMDLVLDSNYECENFDEVLNTFEKWRVQLEDNPIIKLQLVNNDYGCYVLDDDKNSSRLTNCYTLNNLVEFTYQDERLVPRFDEINKEPIDEIEAYIMQCGHNSGLSYLREECFLQSYGKDMSKAYAKSMASKEFLFPIKKGRSKTYKELPEKLEYGKYHMDIKFKNTDIDIKMIFAQRKEPHNKGDDDQKWFMHWDIITLRKYAAEFGGIEMNLINDGYPNAYIYDSKDLVSGYDIFGKWYETLQQLSNLYPDNRLIKKIMSQAYGKMTQKGKFPISMKEYLERDDIGEGKDYILVEYLNLGGENEGVYIRRNASVPYINNIRLQYLAAFTRYIIARDIMENNLQHHVIRVYNDSIVLDKDIDINENYKNETKTTGLIYWYRSDYFMNLTEMTIDTFDKHKHELFHDYLQYESDYLEKQRKNSCSDY